METCIVAGAGQAGAHVAVTARRSGYGGRIVLIGSEAEAPYDRTPLSKAFMLGRTEAITHFFSPHVFADLAIDLRLGTAVEAIDTQRGRVSLSGGITVPYDRLVLATGSRARRLDVPGGEQAMTLRTHRDAGQIKAALTPGRRVVCIGAGVIGLEIAAAARASGCEVVVIERAASAMSRSLLPELAGFVLRPHVARSIKFSFDAEVLAIDGGYVLLEGHQRYPADVVVAGVGVDRNIALAEAAGIAVGRGILTDAAGRTSIEGVFAAGEVAEYYSEQKGQHLVFESWKHAQDHGTHVGRVLAGISEHYDEVPWFWSDQFETNYQVAGDASREGRLVYRGDPHDEAFSAFLLGEDSTLIGAFGVNAGRDISAAIRLMRRSVPIDPALVADTSLSAQRLVSTALAPLASAG